MSCSCSGNQRSGGYGCRKSVAGTVWPSCGAYPPGCNACPPGEGPFSCGGYAPAGAGSCGSAAGCGDFAPFRRGPCGPAEPTCGCTAHCPPSPVPAPYGFFTQTGTLTLDAGAAIPFIGVGRSNGVCLNGGEITLERSGVYLVLLNVTVPESAALQTTVNVRLNGAAVVGGTLVIDKVTTDSPLSACRQLVVTACAGAVLTVTSTEAVSLTAADASEALAALTVVRIS